MGKDKNRDDVRQDVQNPDRIPDEQAVPVEDEQKPVDNADKADGSPNGEPDVNSIMARLEEKSKKCEEYFDMLQRTAAEFDNYRKRTAKEKESLYTEAVCDTVLAFLPVADSMERAIKAYGEKEEDAKVIKEGLEMILRQFKDILNKLGVEEIKSVGEQFDPQFHNAIMHIQNEAYGTNEIVEEFQKGYILEGKVIRHSMVKVAN